MTNPLKTKRRLLYVKTQFVPRSKHFSFRLYKPISSWLYINYQLDALIIIYS